MFPKEAYSSIYNLYYYYNLITTNAIPAEYIVYINRYPK